MAELFKPRFYRARIRRHIHPRSWIERPWGKAGEKRYALHIQELAKDRVQKVKDLQEADPADAKFQKEAQNAVMWRRGGKNIQRGLSVLALGIASASMAASLFGQDTGTSIHGIGELFGQDAGSLFGQTNGTPTDMSWTGGMFSSESNAPIDITPDLSVGGENYIQVPVVDVPWVGGIDTPEWQVIPDVHVPGWAPEAGLAAAGLYAGTKAHLRLRRDKKLGLHKSWHTEIGGGEQPKGTINPEEFAKIYKAEELRRNAREHARVARRAKKMQQYATRIILGAQQDVHDEQQEITDVVLGRLKARKSGAIDLTDSD